MLLCSKTFQILFLAVDNITSIIRSNEYNVSSASILLLPLETVFPIGNVNLTQV